MRCRSWIFEEAASIFNDARNIAIASGLRPRTIVYTSANDEALRGCPVDANRDLDEFLEHAEDGTVESFSPDVMRITTNNTGINRPAIESWWRSVFWSPMDTVSMTPSRPDSDAEAYPCWDATSVALGESRSIIDNGDGDGYTAIKRQKISLRLGLGDIG